MDEKTKAGIYLAYLDLILAGEKVSIPEEELEIKELLLLARTMIEVDYSVSSVTREKLRKQILERVYKKNKSGFTPTANDGELDDDLLDNVAAGFMGQEEEQFDIEEYLRLTEFKDK